MEEKQWYVVNTYSGHENKVKATIEKAVKTRGMEDYITHLVVPTEDVVETTKTGKEKVRQRKIYPSYVLIKMIITDESWYIVRNTKGVTGFVGPGSRPVPLSDEEAMSIEVEAKVEMDTFQIGDEVEIIDGFLTGHSGKISEISEDSSEVTVIVSTVGRDIPVNLDKKYVEKAAN